MAKKPQMMRRVKDIQGDTNIPMDKTSLFAEHLNMEEAIYWSDRLHKIGIGFRHITGMTGPMPAERKHYFFVRGTDQKAILDSALERHSWKVDGYDEAVKVITE